MIELGPMSGAEDPSLPPCPRIVCDGALTLDEIERDTIVATLQHNKGHRQKSAKALGIGVRTLGLKLRKWKDLSPGLAVAVVDGRGRPSAGTIHGSAERRGDREEWH